MKSLDIVVRFDKVGYIRKPLFKTSYLEFSSGGEVQFRFWCMGNHWALDDHRNGWHTARFTDIKEAYLRLEELRAACEVSSVSIDSFWRSSLELII